MTRAATALLLGLAAAGCAPSRSPAFPEEWGGGSPAEEGEYGEPRHRSWEERDRLHTTLMPYAWRSSSRGDAVVKSVPASFDEGPDGEASFGGRVEVYSERVGFFLDGFFTTVSHKDPGVEFDDRVAVFDLGSTMRILGGEPWQMTGERPAADFELDGIALIRNHFLKMDATPAGAFSANSDDEYWFDLVFGMRGAVVLLGRLSLFGKIDGGGMALNQWNSWTWSADVGAKLRITRNLGAVAAYRWFASHWEEGQPEVVINPLGSAALDSSRDIRIQGPWVGIVLEF
jgi:hypothetical protein